jgi:hypothetical protein
MSKDTLNLIKGPITVSIFNPGVELSSVYRVEISALSVIQNSIKITRNYMTKFSTQVGRLLRPDIVHFH